MDTDRRESKTAAQDPQAMEAEQDRLARYAQRSVVLGVIASFGFVLMMGSLIALARGWFFSFVLPLWVLALVYLCVGFLILLASAAGLAYGRLGNSPHNPMRSLAIVGIWVGRLTSFVVLLFPLLFFVVLFVYSARKGLSWLF